MKEIKNLNKKKKAATVLIIITLLLLVSNFFIAKNSKSTNQAIKALYDDRLIAIHFIFKYNNEIHLLKAKAEESNISEFEKKQFIDLHLKSIAKIDKKYLKTILTADEKEQFLIFQLYCAKIKKANQNTNWQAITALSNLSLNRLEVLSQIQVDEGKIKLSTAETLHQGNTIFTQFEIGLLIILGCLSCYLLILKKLKIKIKIPESPSKN